MLSVSCGFNGAPAAQTLLTYYGPTLWVDIGFDPHYTPNPDSAPRAGAGNIEALIDTGADESCIDNLLASQLGRPLVDRRPVYGVTGARTVNIYLAQLHVPALKFTQYGSFAGVDLVANGARTRALVGRTFLRYCRMTYDGPAGIVTLAH